MRGREWKRAVRDALMLMRDPQAFMLTFQRAVPACPPDAAAVHIFATVPAVLSPVVCGSGIRATFYGGTRRTSSEGSFERRIQRFVKCKIEWYTVPMAACFKNLRLRASASRLATFHTWQPQSDATAFPAFLDTYATCLLAEPLRVVPCEDRERPRKKLSTPLASIQPQ